MVYQLFSPSDFAINWGENDDIPQKSIHKSNMEKNIFGIPLDVLITFSSYLSILSIHFHTFPSFWSLILSPSKSFAVQDERRSERRGPNQLPILPAPPQLVIFCWAIYLDLENLETDLIQCYIMLYSVIYCYIVLYNVIYIYVIIALYKNIWCMYA